MSLWTDFCGKWRNGCGSDECQNATTRVLARGKLPCDLLFTGEAPGETEDTFAQPFVGEAGKRVLDPIIQRSVPPTIRYALTNIVGCIPRNHEEGSKASKPPNEQVKFCEPRLVEFIRDIAKPKLIITVGTFARDWLDNKRKNHIKLPRLNELGYDSTGEIPQVYIDHPAFILRQTSAEQSLSMQKCIITISDAINEYLLGIKEE